MGAYHRLAAMMRRMGPFFGVLVSLVFAPGCGAAAPSREPQAMLQPMLTEVNGLMGQLGGGHVVDGPRRVHCNMARDNDPTVRWQVFARTPVSPATVETVRKAVAARRAGGWTVDDRHTAADTTYRLRKSGVFLSVTYLQTGRGDVVLTGQTECFVPATSG